MKDLVMQIQKRKKKRLVGERGKGIGKSAVIRAFYPSKIAPFKWDRDI